MDAMLTTGPAASPAAPALGPMDAMIAPTRTTPQQAVHALATQPLVQTMPLVGPALTGADLALGASEAAGGPLKVPGAVLQNALKEGVDTISGFAQLATGLAVYTPTLLARAAARKMGVPAEADPTLDQEWQTAAHAVPAGIHAVVNDALDELTGLATNPGKRIVEHPLTTALDASMVASLPGEAARLGARAAAKVAQTAEDVGARMAGRAGADVAVGAPPAGGWTPGAAAAAPVDEAAARAAAAPTAAPAPAVPTPAAAAVAGMPPAPGTAPPVAAVAPEYGARAVAEAQNLQPFSLGKRLGLLSADVDEFTHGLSPTALAQRGINELRSASPAFNGWLADQEARRTVGKILEDSSREFMRQRNSMFDEAEATLSPLTPEERSTFAETAMGLRPLSADARPEFTQALDWWRNLSAQREADLVASGAVSADASTMRRFQAQRIAGAADPELQKALERAAKTPGGAVGPDGAKITQEAAKAALERQTRELMVAPAKARGVQVLSQAGGQRAVSELASDLEAAGDKLPVYFPMIQADTERPWEFLPAKPVKRPVGAARPRFLRGSTGSLLQSAEFQKDPALALPRRIAQQLAFEKAERDVAEILKQPFVRQIKDARDFDPKTETLFAPSGTMRFYRGQVKFTEKFFDELAQHADIEEALVRSIKDFIRAPENVKSYLGVMKDTRDLYAVPKSVGRELQARFAATPRWLRLFFDRPIDWWRWTVLAARPAWLVNNIVGNLIFSIMAGTTVPGYLKALSRKYIAAMPADVTGSSMMANEYRTIKLGGAADTGVGRLISALEASPATKVATWLPKQITRVAGYLNNVTDDYFRRATFISEFERREGARAVKQAGGSMLKSMDTVARLDDPAARVSIDEALRHTNIFFNDFSRMGANTRRIFRRIFPFVSWLKHVGRFVLTLPVQYPGRAALINRLNEFAREAVQDRWQQIGVDPAALPSYRRSQFPIAAMPDSTVRAFSTGGANPFSSLGLTGTDMQLEPNLGSAIAGLASSSNPILRAAYEYTMARNLGTGDTYSRPDVVEHNGRFYVQDATTDNGLREVNPPRPGAADLAAEAIPQIGLARSFAEPNKMFDLPGPEGRAPRPVRGELAPSSYPAWQQAAAYMGVPLRQFTRDQLTTPPLSGRDVATIQREFDRRREAAEEARKPSNKEVRK